MIIRQAAEDDLPRLAELTRDALSFASSPDKYQWDIPDDRALGKRLSEYARPGKGKALVVQVENQIVGFVAARYDELDPRNPDRAALIDLLAVDHDHRGKGLGTALVTELKQLLPADGVTRVQTTVLGSNDAAVRFWRRAGFHDLAVTMAAELEANP